MPGASCAKNVRGRLVVEADIVMDARSGEAAAIEKLLCACYPMLQRFLTGLSGDFASAEDLVQEVMVKVLERLPQLNDPAAFLPWLYRIARNQFHSSNRYSQVRRNVSLEQLTEQPSNESYLVSAPHDVDRCHERINIEEVLASLDARSRDVLVLRHVFGYSGREIAEVLGITSAAAFQRIHRAEQRFATCFLAEGLDT
jgi:RNA polymerase sigma factor (sigma-70 family)